jgi:hypothetical protein
VAASRSLLKASLQVGGEFGVNGQFCFTYSDGKIKSAEDGTGFNAENPVFFVRASGAGFTYTYEWEASRENISALIHRIGRSLVSWW